MLNGLSPDIIQDIFKTKSNYYDQGRATPCPGGVTPLLLQLF